MKSPDNTNLIVFAFVVGLPGEKRCHTEQHIRMTIFGKVLKKFMQIIHNYLLLPEKRSLEDRNENKLSLRND